MVKRKGGYISLLPFIGFPACMNGRKMLLPFFTISQQGTKTVPHSIKGTNIRRNNLRMTLSRESATRRPTSRTTRTSYVQRHTSNTIHERAYNEHTTHTTVQSSTPSQESSLGQRALRDRVKLLSILTRLSHHSIIEPEPYPEEMIVMVAQPHPAGGRVARRHRVPGDTGSLPADVPPFFRGYHHLFTCSIPNGGGSHSDRTWETNGKRREKDRK